MKKILFGFVGTVGLYGLVSCIDPNAFAGNSAATRANAHVQGDLATATFATESRPDGSIEVSVWAGGKKNFVQQVSKFRSLSVSDSRIPDRAQAACEIVTQEGQTQRWYTTISGSKAFVLQAGLGRNVIWQRTIR